MLGLGDRSAAYEFERLCAERGLNEFHRKNCNRVLAERILEEEEEEDVDKDAKKNISAGYKTCFKSLSTLTWQRMKRNRTRLFEVIEKHQDPHAQFTVFLFFSVVVGQRRRRRRFAIP